MKQGCFPIGHPLSTAQNPEEANCNFETARTVKDSMTIKLTPGAINWLANYLPLEVRGEGSVTLGESLELTCQCHNQLTA